ncbi:MAG: LLM class flavin-dependent oxidoreductase [Streptosporangiaceae bacterium]
MRQPGCGHPARGRTSAGADRQGRDAALLGRALGSLTAGPKIRLGSAVTVLSSDDPVWVFQRYSTLDAVSGGRAEVILSRGSSIESFPLFGYDLADYEELFDEKATLFAELLKGGPVTWKARPARRC